MSIDHYPHIIPNIGEMDKFWEFFGFWAKRYGYVLRCLKEGAEGDKHFTDYELRSRRGKVYVSSTFYWGERTFLTDLSTFGAWTSEYADASLIDDVISRVGELRLGTVPKQLGCFVDKLHSMLYQYDFYNHDETAYTHAAKLLLLKLPKEMQASACFKCTGKRSFGTSYAKELREKIRKGNEAEWVRPYSQLLNNFFCPGLSDRILSVLDKNNIEIVEVGSHNVMSDVFAKIRERGRDFIREPDEFECCYYKLSVPNKGTDEIYCLPFDDKMFACEFREKFGLVH